MTNSADPDRWLLQKTTDLDLHCLQRQSISGFSRTRVNDSNENTLFCLILVGSVFRSTIKIVAVAVEICKKSD